MTARAPTVWIDMLNSPNVMFCRPLIEELHGRGYGTFVTVRDFAQTRQMCELYGLRHGVIGTHGGAHLARKAANLAALVGQLAHQRPGGSWPYAEAANGGWVDGFHTGFMLDGLAVVAEQADSDVIRESAARGFRFCTRQLFTGEGAPSYYADGREPFDALSAAQGIETLATLGRGDREAEQLLSRLVTWTHANVIDSRNGRVAYQVHRHWTDWRQFRRWSIAPMASALAGLRLGEAGKE